LSEAVCDANAVTIFFFFQAEDGIRDKLVTGVQTCALPISPIGVRRPPNCRRTPTGASAQFRAPRRARCAVRPTPRPPARRGALRSEERRVGKEGGPRWSQRHRKE